MLIKHMVLMILRPFFLMNKKKIPVFADNKTSKYLNSTFKYCFRSSYGYTKLKSLNDLKNKHIFKNKNKKILIELTGNSRTLKLKVFAI